MQVLTKLSHERKCKKKYVAMPTKTLYLYYTDLFFSFVSEMKELRSTQTKTSLMHKRQFSSSDRTTSKAEADRRMKEVPVNRIYMSSSRSFNGL